MTDEEIVLLYQGQKEEAIARTKEKYHHYLLKIALQILGNMEDAEECVNDTYLSAWNSIPKNQPAFLSTYLAKILRQTAIDLLRRKNRQKRQASEYALSLEELEDVFAGGSSPEQELEKKELRQALTRFVKALPPLQRNLFLGRYFYFDSLKEVASYCGMSEAKAKSTLFRIRGKLRKYLKQEGFIL